MKQYLFIAITLLHLCPIVKPSNIVFNKLYVKENNETIQIQEIPSNEIQYTYNSKLISKTKNGNLKINDKNHKGGDIIKLTAKYKNQKNTSYIKYGNILPYRKIVSLGKNNFYPKDVKTHINFKFYSSNPTVATVNNHGTISAFQYGTTIITIHYKKQIKRCKLFVIPRDTKIDEYPIKSINDYKYFLDSKTFNKIKKNNLSYQITNNFPETDDKNAEGLYEYGSAKIKVKSTKATSKVALHELGHFIDDLSDKQLNFDGTSTTEMFKQIYTSNKHEITDPNIKKYIADSPKEYVAEMFSYYTLNPYKMQQEMPKTYEEIKKIHQNAIN